MAKPLGPKPYAARWMPVEDLPPEAETWGVPGYREFVEQWRETRSALEDRRVSRYLMDLWLRQRSRSFAIETGQIEGLYRLRRRITDQLVVEGFEGVRGAHSVEPRFDDETLRGLLEDQEETLEIVFDMAKGGTPLGNSTLKGIHAILTRHQRTAIGFDPITRRRVPIAILRGEYKKWPNNPRRPDGVVHEYCPPEQVDSEMDRFLEFHRSHADRDLPTEVEAAWLHHAFVRIHPFQDGNGRMSRLLVAYAYARRGEFPSIVLADEKEIYLGALEVADDGDLREFVGFLGRRSSTSTGDAVSLARQILAGRDHLRHRNGGLTANGKYYPPEPDAGGPSPGPEDGTRGGLAARRYSVAGLAATGYIGRMAEPPGPKPYGARWRRVADLPPEAESWGVPAYRETVAEWREARRELEDRRVDRSLMDIWLRERNRNFAIETGQIEGLYLLRRGVTEQLITEGFESVRGAHSVTGELEDRTLRGLLDDQEETLEAVFDLAKGGTPLSHTAIRALHSIVTRHQDTAVGIHGITGERIQIPLRKGAYKERPNNPRRDDGFVHEYCPPEQVDSEMDAFLEFHRSHADRDLPTEVEAAWLHHAFVRIHPFQDGNGRMSRLLVAYAFARSGEFPPVVPAAGKQRYIRNLERADDGDLRPFIRYLALRSQESTADAADLARDIVRGRTHLRHGNGGLTSNGKYYPPKPDPV